MVDGKVKKFDHVTPLYEELKWLSMKDLITLNFVTAIFKHRLNTYLDHILPLLTVSTTTHST